MLVVSSNLTEGTKNEKSNAEHAINEVSNFYIKMFENIEDEYLRTNMQIEYQDAVEFFRTSDSVLYMIQMLGLTEKQVNDMWQEGLAL